MTQVMHERDPGPAPVPARKLFDGLFANVRWNLTYAGLLIYVFVIVTFKLGIANIGMLLCLLGLVQQLGRLRFPTPLKWFAVYFVWCAIGSLGATYPEVTQDALVVRGKVLIIAFAAINALRTRPQVRLFLVFFVTMFMLVPARAALLGYVRGNRLFGRAVGSFVFSNPNDLAAICLLVFAIAIALLSTERRRSYIWWFMLGSVPLIALLVLLTQSRGAFLSLALFGVPVVIGIVRRRPRALLGIVAVIAIAISFTPESAWDRMRGIGKLSSRETVADADPEGSARERFDLLLTGLQIVGDHPVFGVGLGAFSYANAEYNPAVGRRDAHNMYLTVAVENGLPGFVFFLGMLVTALLGAWKVQRKAMPFLPQQSEQLRTLAFGLFAFMVAGIFGTFSVLSLFYVYVAVLCSVTECLKNEIGQLASGPVNAATYPPQRRWDTRPQVS